MDEMPRGPREIREDDRQKKPKLDRTPAARSDLLQIPFWNDFDLARYLRTGPDAAAKTAYELGPDIRVPRKLVGARRLYFAAKIREIFEGTDHSK